MSDLLTYLLMFSVEECHKVLRPDMVSKRLNGFGLIRVISYSSWHWLMQGGNRYVINVMTTECNYFSWQEIFLCVQNDRLPDALRAKFCDLMIGIYTFTFVFALLFV